MQDDLRAGRRDAEPPLTLLMVLLVTTAIGPLLNHALAAASPILTLELGISAGAFGLLATLLFASAALASMALGWLADILSIRGQLILNFGGTALALVIASIGPVYWLMVAAVVLGGVTQVIANPTTNRVIYQRVPLSNRATWIGVKQSGVQASQVFAGLFFPAVSLWIGWTGASLIAAGVALVLLIWSLHNLPGESRTDWASIRDVVRPRRIRQRGSTPRLPSAVWLYAIAAFLSGTGTQATNVYLSLFAVREIGLGVIAGGIALGVAGFLGVISRIWWGRALGRGHTPGRLLTLIAAGAVAGMVSMAVASMTHEPVMFWVGVVLHGITVLGTNVVVNGGAMLAVSAGRIGAASGVITMGIYAGFTCGPVGMGALVEATGDFTAGWIAVALVYAVLLVLCAVLALNDARRERNAE
jgi:predicted MFS family arabinose efflux permease